jgi:mycothiol system anti-sigma-R factor
MGTSESDVDCNETIERLYTYLDGELTDERRIEIKRHLDECPPCLDAFDFEADLRQVIADRCRDHVPDALRQRIHDALMEAERERQPAED